MTNDLESIFNRLKNLLKKYEEKLVKKYDDNKRYELWSNKEVIIEERKKKEVFFASLIIQSSYVGFYFMPIYTDTELKEVFSKELLKLLKGKSCFHIKKIDDNLIEDIINALDIGYASYLKKGWI